MRFFKPESREYISDFVPQDINAIYKMKQNLDADAEKTETAIAVSQNAFNLKPGEMTGPLANNLNKMYQGESQKIADNYYSGNIDEPTARVQIAKLTNHFNNNPEVQTVQYDNELIPVASALRANPLFGDYGISEGKDPQTGNWKPVQKSMTRAELQEAYKTYFPGDGFKELTPVLNSIMPDVLEGNTTIEGYDPNKTTALGKGLYNVKTATGYKTVKLDETKVRREIHDWVDANWERNNYEHYVYGRKRGDFQKPIDWENYIVNQFVGSRNDSSDAYGESVAPVKTKAEEEEEEGNGIVPLYDTPQTTLEGSEETTDFDLKQKGSIEPYTSEEAEAIYKEFGTTKDGIGYAAERAAFKIAAGKQRGGTSYSDIKEMSGENQKLTLSSLKLLNEAVYQKALKGEMSDGEKALFYPKIKEMSKMLNQTLLESSTVVGFDEKDYNEINVSLFGQKEPKVKNLGTGNSGNTKFYNKTDKRIMTLSQIKSEFPSEEEVKVSGNFTADNPFSFVTNDESFSNAKQLFIGGKEIVINGPKGYTTKGSNDNENKKQLELDRMKNVNKIYNSKFSLVPVQTNLYGINVKYGFKPFDNKDRSKGEFIVYVNNKEKTFSSPQKADQFILEEAQKRKE